MSLFSWFESLMCLFLKGVELSSSSICSSMFVSSFLDPEKVFFSRARGGEGFLSGLNFFIEFYSFLLFGSFWLLSRSMYFWDFWELIRLKSGSNSSNS